MNPRRLEMRHFFRRRGAVVIVAWIGLCHGTMLLATDIASTGDLDRWLDVMVSVSVVAAVVQFLATQNQRLVDKLAAEAPSTR